MKIMVLTWLKLIDKLIDQHFTKDKILSKIFERKYVKVGSRFFIVYQKVYVLKEKELLKNKNKCTFGCKE